MLSPKWDESNCSFGHAWLLLSDLLHTPSDQKGRKTLSYKFQFENRNLSTWFAADMLSPYQREWVSILKAQPLLESRPVKVKRPCCAMPHKNTRGTDSAPRLLRPAQVNTIQ